MKVKEAMHKGVQWAGPSTSVEELAKLMQQHDIGAIPIGENDKLIGMVTTGISSVAASRSAVIRRPPPRAT